MASSHSLLLKTIDASGISGAVYKSNELPPCTHIEFHYFIIILVATSSPHPHPSVFCCVHVFTTPTSYGLLL